MSYVRRVCECERSCAIVPCAMYARRVSVRDRVVGRCEIGDYDVYLGGALLVCVSAHTSA